MKVTLPQNWSKVLSIFAVLLTFVAVSFAQPIVVPTSVCSGSTARLTVTNAAPTGFYYAWYQDAALTNLLGIGSAYTTGPLTTVASATFYVAQVNGTTLTPLTPRTAIVVTVKPVPSAPTIAPAAACYGLATTVTATPAVTVPASTINWYTLPVGVSPSPSTAGVLTTPALTQPTVYYARAMSNGCESAAKAVTVGINQLPATPTVADQNICTGTTATITGTGTNSLTTWTYTDAAAVVQTGTALPFTTSALAANTNVKVQNVSAQGCKSAIKTAVVYARAVPATPTIVTPTICTGKTATLRAVGGNALTEWRTGSATGTLVYTGSTYVTPALTAAPTTPYFVIANNSGCKGGTTTASVIVSTVSAPVTAATTYAVCDGKAAAIVLVPEAGASVAWYADLNGGTRLSAATTYTTPALTQTTYFYAQQTLAGCVSPMREVRVSVNPLPAMPQFITNPTICANNSVTLRLANGGTTTQWYWSATRNELEDTLRIGSTFTTPVLTSTQTYYVRNVSTSTGCKSNLASQVVTVNAAPNAYAGGDRTVNYGDDIQLTGKGGLLYSWSNGGLLDNPYVFNPTTSTKLPVGANPFVLTVTDGNGCTDTDDIFVFVTNTPVQNAFPNVITPNGDGVNDVLMLPFLTEKYDTPYTFKIYTRSGNVVLNTKNYDQSWGAQDLPDDTYWYVLEIAGDKKDYRGFITVKR
jgi:large repetitive protein